MIIGFLLALILILLIFSSLMISKFILRLDILENAIEELYIIINHSETNTQKEKCRPLNETEQYLKDFINAKSK